MLINFIDIVGFLIGIMIYQIFKIWKRRNSINSLRREINEKEEQMRSKKSRNLDRSKVALKDKNEVDYLRRACKRILHRIKNESYETKVTIRAGSLRRMCRTLLKLL